MLPATLASTVLMFQVTLEPSSLNMVVLTIIAFAFADTTALEGWLVTLQLFELTVRTMATTTCMRPLTVRKLFDFSDKPAKPVYSNRESGISDHIVVTLHPWCRRIMLC